MFIFFFQAEDGIRDLVRSRGLGDVYKRQVEGQVRQIRTVWVHATNVPDSQEQAWMWSSNRIGCLLYTSDAADERSSVDLGGRRIIKKKTTGELLA